MIDPRFYELKGPRSLSEIARIVGAFVPDGFDPDLEIETCGPLGEAGASSLVYFQGNAAVGMAAGSLKTSGVACLVRPTSVHVLPDHVAPLVVKSARAGFSLAASALVQRRELCRTAAQIDVKAKIEDGVTIGHNVIIGEGAEIGSGTTIAPNSVHWT
jgi:UDP-3-O-[3-hydroxymyristoyl] glucosamine N-acyltransferase